MLRRVTQAASNNMLVWEMQLVVWLLSDIQSCVTARFMQDLGFKRNSMPSR